MKRVLGILILGTMCFSLNNAFAGGKKSGRSAPPSTSADQLRTPRCSAQNCVVVVLSSVKNVQGTLQIWSKDPTTKAYVKKGNECVAIGGNPDEYPGQEAIYTPRGIYKVTKKTPELWYNHGWDHGFEDASQFYDPNPLDPGGNKVAIHTVPSYTQSSHGCVRSPCAPNVYALTDSTEVQVGYP